MSKFDKNPIITDAFERLKAKFGETPKGAFVPWSEIDAVLGEIHLESRAWTAFERFRKWTLDTRRIVLDVEQGAGVRWASDHDVVFKIAPKRMRKSRRQANRALKQCDAVDTSGLSVHERRAFAHQKDGMRLSRLIAGRTYREAEKAAEASQVNPQRPEPTT